MFALEIKRKVGTKRYEQWKQAAQAAKQEAAKRKTPALIRPVPTHCAQCDECEVPEAMHLVQGRWLCAGCSA